MTDTTMTTEELHDKARVEGSSTGVETVTVDAPTDDTRRIPAWQIEQWFRYHPPTDEQIECYSRIREEAREFAHTLNSVLPEGPDKTVAIRSLRETVMLANSALACAVV